jgi:hypothetical protein
VRTQSQAAIHEAPSVGDVGRRSITNPATKNIQHKRKIYISVMKIKLLFE